MLEDLNESFGDLDEGLPEPLDLLATLPHLKMREEILHLFNEDETQEAVKEKPPKLILKPLPTELKYAYLEENKQSPVVISSSFTTTQEDYLLEILRRCKKAIEWKISDLKGIGSLVCTHHIYMEEEARPVRHPQKDSPWVSPTQVVPKKSGIIVVQNDKGEEVSTCLTSGHPFYCFLDGYSGYFQIEIAVEDHEKTTFTCPFGTYAYRRMPFGLCNALATFQRGMLSIFSDMVERIMEVVMDDITVYGNVFDECLVNLEVMMNRCIEKDLVLNWEKCHFMLLLTTAPIVRAPNWQFSFEVMCDARSFIVVFTDHSALKYLLTKQDAKARLIRWILLLQEFNLHIKDKKVVENMVADHLSRLAIAHNSHSLPINDDFPEESLMLIEAAPWYAHIANYLVTGEVPRDPQSLPRKRMWRSLCFSEDSYEVSQSGFCWPSLFKDAFTMCRSCDRCQRLGKLTLDYVSKWVEAIPCKCNDHRVVLNFLKENIFSRFGVPKAIISDGGTHLCNKPFETLLAKYGVKHKVVNTSRRDWSVKLHDSLLPYRTTFKTILGMSSYLLVYGKACHLPVEVQYKTWWAIKTLNMDLN
ncbi:Retrovirus-related Pol polyprotein from transposon 17.6 [Vitis vinifera]|uniref:Retrovirus-related Pol polyprotein from transposon 17.6 n=1 Tax=Vitis vinifera TaxID=29760 RepID=A0A438C5I2_VITVI|nr:Retrovirus-related Pol polyprotein from transposon 17.6 [Vitis vinifera]